IRMASKVKQALDKNQVKCYGQLVVPLEANRPGATHCEVLTTIETDNGERLTPDRYLPALEKFGLSTEYDHHVVATTLKAMSRSTTSQEMGWGWVSINLSAQTVCNPPSLDVIKDLFQRYSVPPTSVCFEITETAHLQNMSSALTFMSSLHEMGCMLALDDFGSGHSSFEHLLNLPFDIVKIDGQFITNLCNSASHQSIVKSICDLASQLDILTVAEMVEDAPTTELIRKLGVKYGQGFYLAGRQPLEDLLDTPTELLQLNPKVLNLFGDK
ncbi:MAG: EAL domain-containing protein, partial [Gammaproteobacteria bacterium]|nr:EAL domain-containing protein [Gammaproteobacteria bacterium]